MADKCPPIHLPIQIEATCGSSRSSCDCKEEKSCYEKSLCSIDTPITVQGSYHGECKKIIEQIPSLQIAYLSNVRNQCNSDLSILLNPVCLNWCDFLILFYRFNGGVFNISPQNGFSCAVNFNSQTYENTTNKCVKLNLGQLVKQAWANKCETSIDNIPPKTNILLNKEVFSVNSLINSNSAISLTLDQAFETLLNNGEIAIGDYTTSAKVKFIIQYKYCFKPLDTCVIINFVYETKIPCYKNVNQCDNWCPPYSKDTDCRTCIDTSTEADDILHFINNDNNDNEYMDFDKKILPKNISKNMHRDDASNNGSIDDSIISDIKDFNNLADDIMTKVTDNSSTW